MCFLFLTAHQQDIQEQHTEELQMSPPLSLCTFLTCNLRVVHKKERMAHTYADASAHFK